MIINCTTNQLVTHLYSEVEQRFDVKKGNVWTTELPLYVRGDSRNALLDQT